MTLLELIMKPLLFDQNKHDLGETWAEDYVNKLSNMDLLELLSDSLGEFREEGD